MTASTSPRSMAIDHGAVALIAGNDLELGAEELVEHTRKNIGGGARIGGGHEQPLCCAHPAMVCTPAVYQTASVTGLVPIEPIQENLLASILHAFDADGLRGDQRIRKHADRGAVLRRDRIEIVGHLDAAGADHVLRHQRSDCPGICACMKRASSRASKS